ncbi:class III lanthionine synthetase LanKC [Kitasatospora viridis]|uniref:non-specific serine/threonine protein kinase n=1 Tax=Kitasatospora viridis TaxID=281105 RepID=A0A561SFD3_9ACTN|nr:class III lanthionine synthetase LanKC [Kitasatospora viridis]TWF73579.1 protein kinase-like protein [Kitasatospora viridis]
MDDRYERHCLADPLFYEDPARAERADDRFAAATVPLPPGWSRHEHGPWVNLRPPHAQLPDQGWKVHVSATPEEAERVVDLVLAYCLEHGLTWKFLRGRGTVLMLNAKYADRRSSGKLITLYPEDDARLAQVLDQLSALLKGVRGPYVLSDLRYRDGPLYLRYGSFVERYCTDEHGERVPAMRGPDGGLVPDTRGTVFAVPDGVPVPEPVAAQLAADREREAEAADEFPFSVTKALHFSNGGGIYLATDQRDGRQVVLREARPHAGLDHTGRDAVQRLLSERQVLESLDGLDFVPTLYEYRQVWEHHFLVEEHIEGERLEDVFTRTCPLAHPAPDEAELAEYTAWALDVVEQLGGMLAVLHERGVVFGDLHPNNVLIRPDGRCALVDFEISFPADGTTAPPLGAPGFVSSAARRGTAVDAYALAAVRLYLFLPVNNLLALDSGKAELAGREIVRRYPVPEGFEADLTGALRRATGGELPLGATELDQTAPRPAWPQAPAADTAAWRPVLDSLAAGILATATPDRSDRLFPGDIEQFGPGHGGLSLSYGAAGVLHALRACGGSVPAEHVEWLVTRANTAPDLPPGLYDGLTGIAWALARLGAPEAAGGLVERLLTTALPADPGLGSGRAGLAIGLLDLAGPLGHPEFADRALELGHRLAREERAPRLRGLLDGWSGQAALFLRLHAHTGEPSWLRAAEAALGRELDEAEITDGMLFLVEDRYHRKLPYLAAGGVGTAGLIAELARRTGPERLPNRLPARFAEALTAAERACLPELVAAAGLFEGRAGLLLHLARTGRTDAVDRQLRLLEWQVMSHQGHFAFPGRRSLRLSTDLATGAAGVLTALHEAVLGPVPLPGITDLAARPEHLDPADLLTAR